MSHKINVVIYSKSNFLNKILNKILDENIYNYKIYNKLDNFDDDFSDFIENLDLFIFEIIKEDSKKLYNYLRLIPKKRKYNFKRYPVILILNNELYNDFREFEALGAYILKQPFNPQILLSSIKNFLSPEKIKIMKYKTIIPMHEKPVVYVKRKCMICDSEVTLSVYDPKKMFIEYNDFFLQIFKPKAGYIEFNLGDDLLICQKCLFISTHRHDFYSVEVDDFYNSLLYKKENLVNKLKSKTDERLGKLVDFFNNLDYEDKKEIGILGNISLDFKDKEQFYAVLHTLTEIPRHFKMRLFFFQLYLDILQDIKLYFTEDDKKALIDLELGNTNLKIASLYIEKHKNNKAKEYLKESLIFYKNFINKKTSYYVLYRIAVIYSLIYDFYKEPHKRQEAVSYIGQIMTASRRRYSQISEDKEEKVPRILLEKAQDLYSKLRYL